MTTPPRVVAIVGPTAVGKTALALRVAARLDAEIVCADSRQVYRHLDIGTGKPTATERAAAPHHLLDVVDPDEHFDSAEFRRLAVAALEEIGRRGRAVVLCGGSGLYVKALLRGLFAGPKADPALRARLADEERAGGPGTLHRRLATADPATARRLHPHDLVRIVRALEVHALTGRPMSTWQGDHAFGETRYPTLLLGLWRERAALAAAITARCEAMVAAGLVEEVRALWARGYGPGLGPLRTLGYRHVGAHLRGERTLVEAVAEMAADTRRYAKRQLTWFRADPAVRWFHAEREAAAALAAAAAFVAGGSG
jgi:tRNA dimethylallyltransferase